MCLIFLPFPAGRSGRASLHANHSAVFGLSNALLYSHVHRYGTRSRLLHVAAGFGVDGRHCDSKVVHITHAVDFDHVGSVVLVPVSPWHNTRCSVLFSTVLSHDP